MLYIVVNATNINYETALMKALEYGYFEIVKYLVKHGADVNARDNTNKTALMYASKWGQLEMVKCLVEHGADINTKDIDDKTALKYAFENHFSEIVRYLAKKSFRRKICALFCIIIPSNIYS